MMLPGAGRWLLRRRRSVPRARSRGGGVCPARILVRGRAINSSSTDPEQDQPRLTGFEQILEKWTNKLLDDEEVSVHEKRFAAEFVAWSGEQSQATSLPAWLDFFALGKGTSLYFIERAAPHLRQREASRDRVHDALSEAMGEFGDLVQLGRTGSTSREGKEAISRMLTAGQACDIFCLSSRDLTQLNGVSLLRPDTRVRGGESEASRTLVRCFPIAFVRLQALRRWGTREAFDAERARRAAVKARRIQRLQRGLSFTRSLAASGGSRPWWASAGIQLRPPTVAGSTDAFDTVRARSARTHMLAPSEQWSSVPCPLWVR